MHPILPQQLRRVVEYSKKEGHILTLKGAYIITWETPSDGIKATIPNRIAAILPSRTSEKQLATTLPLLLANYFACSAGSGSVQVSEQMRCAKGDFPFRLEHLQFGQYHCGDNPFLSARKARNLALQEDLLGDQILTWEEDVYPILKPLKDERDRVDIPPITQCRKFTYRAATNEIAIGKPYEKKGNKKSDATRFSGPVDALLNSLNQE